MLNEIVNAVTAANETVCRGYGPGEPTGLQRRAHGHAVRVVAEAI